VPGQPLAITRAGLVGTLLLAVVIAACVRLGVWQLDRREQRQELNTLVSARMDAPPLAGAEALADTAGLVYRTLDIDGVWDHERSIVLPGRSHRGVPGVHLITPLRPAGRSDAVLVNRGWVPSPDASTIDVTHFGDDDSASFRALVLPFPGADQSLAQRAPAAGDAGPGGAGAGPDRGFRRVWYTVDATALRAQHPYPLLPVMLQALPAEGAAAAGRTGQPTRLDPPPLDEGPHLGYALQWFGFAIIGVIGWIALVVRSRMTPRSAPPVARPQDRAVGG
jgi:surfeit locus 1 family protein